MRRPGLFSWCVRVGKDGSMHPPIRETISLLLGAHNEIQDWVQIFQIDFIFSICVEHLKMMSARRRHQSLEKYLSIIL